jgi:hypothetical protein
MPLKMRKEKVEVQGTVRLELFRGSFSPKLSAVSLEDEMELKQLMVEMGNNPTLPERIAAKFEEDGFARVRIRLRERFQGIELFHIRGERGRSACPDLAEFGKIVARIMRALEIPYCSDDHFIEFGRTRFCATFSLPPHLATGTRPFFPWLAHAA